MLGGAPPSVGASVAAGALDSAGEETVWTGAVLGVSPAAVVGLVPPAAEVGLVPPAADVVGSGEVPAADVLGSGEVPPAAELAGVEATGGVADLDEATGAAEEAGAGAAALTPHCPMGLLPGNLDKGPTMVS